MKIYNVYSGYGTDGNYNCCPSLFEYGGGITVAGGTTYTYQIIYKCDTGYTHPNYMYQYQYGNSGYITEFGSHDDSKRVHLGDGWYHAWNTFTTNASCTYINTGLWYYQYNVKDKVSVAAVSITLGTDIGSATELIPSYTTRSATDVLIDQTRRSTINVVSSYNSNGKVSFDGTDDYLEVSSFNVTTNEFTIEAVIKPTATSGNYSIIKKNTSNDNWPIFSMGISGNDLTGYYSSSTYGQCLEGVYTTNNPITNNNWYHVVFSKGTAGYTSMLLYINGTSVSYTNYLYGSHINNIATSDKPIHIGRDLDGVNWVSAFAGEIPIVRVYNRQLTSAEISQNFTAYKRRFGI